MRIHLGMVHNRMSGWREKGGEKKRVPRGDMAQVAFYGGGKIT